MGAKKNSRLRAELDDKFENAKDIDEKSERNMEYESNQADEM